MSRTLHLFTLLAFSAACSSAEPGRTPPPPGALQLRFEPVPLPTELPYITDMKFLPEPAGELLVTDLYGGFEHVRLGESGAEVLMAGKVDDIFASYDAGQLALAIDPAFADNRYFYVAATLAKDHVVLRRYTLVEGDADATVASAVRILDITAPGAPRWHNITSMGFDEDGVMWVLVGDKGLFDPAQDPTTLLGSLIRIEPSREPGVGGYTVPEGAPRYSGQADPAVYAIGIRSPWKGVYHDGRWFFGDVGLDDVEEIDVISAAGNNFGWPLIEGPCADDVLGTGPHDCAAFVDPLVHYDRSNSHPYVLDDLEALPTTKRSVYAGWVHRPGGPDPYDGHWRDVLVFGDAFVGFVRAMPTSAVADESWHAGHLPFPSAWDQGPDGYVYVMALSEEPDPKDALGEGGPSPLYRAVLAP